MLRHLTIALLLSLTLPSFAQYNIKRLMEEGRNSLDAGAYVASMQIFHRIVSLKPKLYEAWYLMALAKYHLEDYKGADDACVKALALQPYIADIFELYGMTCIREERFPNAIEAYTKALDINPDNQEYWFNRAYCLYMTDNRKEAATQLAYIRKRWPMFEQAKTFEEEVKAGRKPKTNQSTAAKSNIMKLSLLNKGAWLMQRMDKEGKPKAENKQIKVKLY